MEKIKQIKSKLDKISGQGLDNWNSLKTNVKEEIDSLLLDFGFDTVEKFMKVQGGEEMLEATTEKIMTLFRAWMQAENAGGVISI